MTRENAKKQLMHIIAFLNPQLDGADIKALNMAIDALEQEPCDDTVSIRKDTLKTRVGNIVAYNVEWLKKHWQMEMDIVCGVKPCDDAISREAVISVINILADKMDESGKTAAEQFISAIKDMR